MHAPAARSTSAGEGAAETAPTAPRENCTTIETTDEGIVVVQTSDDSEVVAVL
jgi:hypothetical protein